MLPIYWQCPTNFFLFFSVESPSPSKVNSFNVSLWRDSCLLRSLWRFCPHVLPFTLFFWGAAGWIWRLIIFYSREQLSIIPFVEFFILFSKQGLEQLWGFQTVDEACFTVVFPILYGWVSMFNFVNALTVALNSYWTTLWRSCHLLSQTWWVFIFLSFHGACFRFMP